LENIRSLEAALARLALDSENRFLLKTAETLGFSGG
jgi:hypothetical protein